MTHESNPTRKVAWNEAHDHSGTRSPCLHEWIVFSTALSEGWLMLQCVECGMHGTVNDPSADEWSAAFHAPSKPYRWAENDRVTLRGAGPTYVSRKPTPLKSATVHDNREDELFAMDDEELFGESLLLGLREARIEHLLNEVESHLAEMDSADLFGEGSWRQLREARVTEILEREAAENN